MNYLALVLVFLTATFQLHANTDWGGGRTQFTTQSGQALTQVDGLAVLISVSSGSVIDVEGFLPPSPDDLISVGASLTSGGNVNTVLATSNAFHSGFLLNSAVPDFMTSDNEAIGVGPGERLYLIVWDTSTFVSGAPTDNSYFTLLPLYSDGDTAAPAETPVDSDFAFSEPVSPDLALEAEAATFAAAFAGHNAITDFEAWIQQFDSVGDTDKEGDLNHNGRTNYEEYAFNKAPELVPATKSASKTSSLIKTEDTSGLELSVQLRGSDANLSYYVKVSPNLDDWSAYSLTFVNQEWVCDSDEIAVQNTIYDGNGVWTVYLRHLDSNSPKVFFQLTSKSVEI